MIWYLNINIAFIIINIFIININYILKYFNCSKLTILSTPSQFKFFYFLTTYGLPRVFIKRTFKQASGRNILQQLLIYLIFEINQSKCDGFKQYIQVWNIANPTTNFSVVDKLLQTNDLFAIFLKRPRSLKHKWGMKFQ